MRLLLRKDSLRAGLSNLQSVGSEMEALQEAYRQIHVVEDSDDHYKAASPSSPQHTRQSLQPVSTNESGQTLHWCDWRKDAWTLKSVS